MNWRFAPTIGLVAVLAPAVAHAQTNLDQGKSASQIFAAACSECHKAPRGLANGRNNAALTDFLREHYTTSRDQAAALAAYVQGGRGTEPVGGPAQGKGQKPAAERAEREAPAPEEAKPSKRQARPSKPDDAARTEAKSDAKPEVKPDIELGPGDRPPTTPGPTQGAEAAVIAYGAGRDRSGARPGCSGAGRTSERGGEACTDANAGDSYARRCGVRRKPAGAARQHPRLRTLDCRTKKA